MSEFRSFEDLEFWKKGRAFRISISELVKSFPKEEKYRLADQLIRASKSITANIAEGHGRFHYQENIQYCRMARGSLAECLDHLICSYDSGYISKVRFDKFRDDYDQSLKLANGYIKYLKTRKSKT